MQSCVCVKARQHELYIHISSYVWRCLLRYLCEDREECKVF